MSFSPSPAPVADDHQSGRKQPSRRRFLIVSGLCFLAGLLLIALGILLGVLRLFGSFVWLAPAAWYVVGGVVLLVLGSAPRLRRWPWKRPTRSLLRWTAGSLAGVLAFIMPLVLSLGWLIATVPVSNVGQLTFENELAVPELLEPTIDDQGTLVFDLDAQRGQETFADGVPTETMGYNGNYLGPTLRASRGDHVRVNVTNHLDEITTTHWHGMHLPAAADGGPHQMIEPHQTWSPEWTIDQPAASLWYHPHMHGTTAEQVYAGLTGMFVIDDEHASTLELPETYGIDDIPLIVQDKFFNDAGQFDFNETLSGIDVLGDEILVNGTHDPYVEVDRSLIRLRILNGSNGRIFNFGFDDDRSFQQIATDGGLLPNPLEAQRIQLSPGERAEIVVGFEPGDDTILHSYPADTGALIERRVGAADTFDILRITAADELEDVAEVPDELAAIQPLQSASDSPDRTIELGDETINGLEMDMGRIDYVIAAGATEVWDIENIDIEPHNFHIHDKHFQVVSVDGKAPPPDHAGWHDTVYVRPGSTVRIIIEFGQYTDAELPYMFHCHWLVHEDNGMMGQFTIVDPDDVDDAPRQIDPPESHHGHH